MKRIITCSDGTWNNPNITNEGVISPTNVFQIKELIPSKSITGIDQITFYDFGVGTDWFDRLAGGAFGIGINKNIVDAYMHIVNHYEPGDEIYLFGFSRGAYTARSVAGLIRNSGLLTRDNEDKINVALDLYRRRDDASHPSAKEAIAFRRKYCHPEVKIKFIGVWDTVGPLGIPLKWFNKFNKELMNCQFHDVTLSRYIENAYHAVSIDDHRKPYLPTLWKQQEDASKTGQVMEQMWFAGVHCDVGGSYRHHGLSDCALHWMIEKAKAVGLEFNDYKHIRPYPYDKMHNSMNLLYSLFGHKNRKIGNGLGYNELISQTAMKRWDNDIDNYQQKSNEYLLKFLFDGKRSMFERIKRCFLY
ncbi:MAG: DUF2235 domain-containing protein [Paludibacter sp.]